MQLRFGTVWGKMIWVLALIAMSILATAHAVAGNVSDLYGASGEKWNPAGRLPDFSWAGYRGGEPIPAVAVKVNVRDFGARGDGRADDTRAFQRAISAIKSGAILVPKGRYRITGILEIAKPGLVLRGEGEGATVLFLEKPLKDLLKEVPYYGGIIWITGKDRGQKITDITSAAQRGGTSLSVRSPKTIRAGQMIRLRMRNPQDNSLGRYLYADQGALNAERRRWYDGQIVNWAVRAKNVAADAIELARPLRLDVRPQWQPEIWSHQPTVQDVGIEDLTIEFPNAQYAGHHKEEGHFAIYLNGTYDCWVRNVTVIDSDIGVVVQGGGRNEVTNVTLKTRWRTGEQTAGETGHYGLVATSHAQDSLFENCRLETMFVHNLSVNAFANGNVYSSITSRTGRFDHHGGAPYENLFTDILITHNASDLFYSGGNRADEPNAGARTTFWNIRTKGGKFPGKIMSHADGSPRLPQVNIIGIARWPTKKTATVEWIEAWPGETTQPPNLYRAQSANRRMEQNRARRKVAPSKAETNRDAGGTFRVHPDNPRCFLYQGKPLKILTSAEHYGAVLNGDFDYDVYLDEMQKTGQNMTRTFTFYREKASSIPGPGAMNTLAPSLEAAVMPWLRAPGSGKGGDGLEKFDLERWNPAYFARWKDFLRKCAEHGVICEVVLFCNPYDRGKYDMFPSAAASNVNGVGRDIGDPREFMMLKDPTVTAFQERFVRKMAAELNEFDNLYFEICNEPNVHGNFSEATEKEVVAWQLHLASVLRKAEAALPKRHLIAVNAHYRVALDKEKGKGLIRHDDVHYFNHPDIDVINYHYISAKADAREFRLHHLGNEAAQAGNIWRFLRERDSWTKPLVFDETFSGIVRKQPERYAINRAEAWEMILSGGAGYDNLDWSFTPADETGSGGVPIGDGRRLDGRPLRKWFAILSQLLAEYDVAALVPAVGLLREQVPGYAYAASTDGKGRYLIYLVDEKLYRQQSPSLPSTQHSSLGTHRSSPDTQHSSLIAQHSSLRLSLPEGRYTMRMFDPKTGETTAGPTIESPGVVPLALSGFDQDIAVLIDRVREAKKP